MVLPAIEPEGPNATHAPPSGPRLARPSASWLPPEPTAERISPSRPTIFGDLKTVLLMFLLWRGLLFGVDYVGRCMTTPMAKVHHWDGAPFWDGYLRLDTGWFATIIRGGYRLDTKDPKKNVAFFPLYPYTVKALAEVRLPGYGKVFGNFWVPGLILSNVSLVLSLFYLLRVARASLDEEEARRSLVYLLAFPTSIFFSMFYSEGLFLLTTSASFYHFLKGQNARCGAWGFLAAMTRSPGVLLLPAFVLGHLWERGFRVRRSDLSLLWLGLIPCGLAAVMGVFYWELGDPFAFSKAHAAWGRTYMAPYTTLWNAIASIDWTFPLGNFGNTMWALEVVSSVVFLALPLFLLRGHHKALPIYSVLLILMPLSTGSTLSMMRCEVVAFPAFFALARFGRDREVDRLIVYGLALFLALFKLASSNYHNII